MWNMEEENEPKKHTEGFNPNKSRCQERWAQYACIIYIICIYNVYVYVCHYRRINKLNPHHCY